MVGPREFLRSVAVVNVLAEANVPDVATSLHVPIPQLYTARCGTAAYGVNLFASLVKHRGEHLLVTLRAHLGELVLVHLPVHDVYTAAPPPPPPPPLDPVSIPTVFSTSRRRVFTGPGNRPLPLKEAAPYTTTVRPCCHSRTCDELGI